MAIPSEMGGRPCGQTLVQPPSQCSDAAADDVPLNVLSWTSCRETICWSQGNWTWHSGWALVATGTSTIAEGRALLLMEPLVELGRKVDSTVGDVECIMGVLIASLLQMLWPRVRFGSP